MNKKKSLNEVSENAVLSLWGEIFKRSPDQINQIHQSDSELVSFYPNGEDLIAVSTDTMEEEIALGFFETPEAIGFAAVMSSVSDLAAVGANPIGVVCSLSLTSEYRSETMRAKLANGIEKACRELGMYVLGGDTNWSERLSISVTAIGRTTRKEARLRTHMEEGDFLYSTGLFGLGSARAGLKILNIEHKIFNEPFPIARLREGMFLSKYASAMMDTSDGLLSTLDQLSRVNNCGFKLSSDITELIRPELHPLIMQMNLPPLMFLASEVGDYELIFCIKPSMHEQFLKDSQQQGFSFCRIGKVTKESDIYILNRKIDTLEFRQLYNERDLSVRELMECLVKLCK